MSTMTDQELHVRAARMLAKLGITDEGIPLMLGLGELPIEHTEAVGSRAVPTHRRTASKRRGYE